MRAERDILIDASPEEIWELVSNPDNYDRFWHGLTRLERRRDHRRREAIGHGAEQTARRVP